jgi:DNA-binding GntR family transcriptional regulator
MSSTWTPIQHTHLTDQVYAAVRDRILSRLIKIDEQVNVEEIAAELRVSRTPVVDAIKRLAAEGLVEVKARRGTYVRGISEHDLIEIFQIREALELFALRHAIESDVHDQVVKEMSTLLQAMGDSIDGDAFSDYSRFTMADRAFHTVMIDSCDNQRMKDSYENLNIHLHIMRSHFFEGLEPPKRVHADHTEILEALIARDYASAEKVVRNHLSSIRTKMIDNIRKAGGML